MILYAAAAVAVVIVAWAYKSRGEGAAATTASQAADAIVSHTKAMRDAALVAEVHRRISAAPDVAADVDRLFAPLAPAPSPPAQPPAPPKG